MRFLLALTLAASGLGAPAAAAPSGQTASPAALYAARTSAQMMVVVDVNAEKTTDGAGAPIFIFYAQPVEGHDLFVNYYVFDCAKGTATLQKKVGVSKYIEPLDLKATGGQPYRVPPGSLVSQVMNVACRGRAAIPATWTPLTMNLRQISANYYRGYLGQNF